VPKVGLELVSLENDLDASKNSLMNVVMVFTSVILHLAFVSIKIKVTIALVSTDMLETDSKMDQDALTSTNVLTRLITIVTVSMDFVSIKKANIDADVMMDISKLMRTELNALMSMNVMPLIPMMHMIVILMLAVITLKAATTVLVSTVMTVTVLPAVISMNVTLVNITAIQILGHAIT